MNVEEDSMFDVSPMLKQPFGVVTAINSVKAKNAREDTTVEYVKGGINKRETFDTYEEAEKWAKSKGLKKVKDPEEEGEYRLTQG